MNMDSNNSGNKINKTLNKNRLLYFFSMPFSEKELKLKEPNLKENKFTADFSFKKK